MKQSITEKICLIYTEENLDIKEKIEGFLTKRFGEKEAQKAPYDCAVIVISDAAVEDPQWQEEVRALSDSIRLIPVGGTIDADYNNPEVIPPTIEELNFIRINDEFLDHINESILLDEEFYRIRSEVLADMQPWIASGHADAFLMTESKRIKRDMDLMKKEKENTKEEVFLRQLQEIIGYLEASKKYAAKLRRKKIRRYASYSLFGLLLVAMISASVIFSMMYRRTAREMTVLTQDINAKDAGDRFTLLADALINPLITGTVRGHVYTEIEKYLDIDWLSQPIGLGYRKELSRAQLLGDNGSYLMVNTDSGTSLIWDTSSCTVYDTLEMPEGTLHSYYDEETSSFVVVKENGEIGFLFGDGAWLSNGIQYPFSGNEEVYIRTNGSYAVVYDDQYAYSFAYETADEGDPAIRLISYITPDTAELEDYHIRAAGINTDGLTVLIEAQDEILFEYASAEGGSRYLLPLSMDSQCIPDICEYGTVFADTDGNVWLMREGDSTLYTTGLMLPNPGILRFADEDTILWYDQSFGSHLYDMMKEVDLGEIFVGLGDIEEITVSGDYAVCKSDGAYRLQSIASVLSPEQLSPLEQLQQDEDRDITDLIAQKYHHTVSKEVYDLISQETIDDLSLSVTPGTDGKEWE